MQNTHEFNSVTFEDVTNNIISGKYDVPESADNKLANHISFKFHKDLQSSIQHEITGIVYPRYADNIIHFVKEEVSLDDIRTRSYKLFVLKRVKKFVQIIENK